MIGKQIGRTVREDKVIISTVSMPFLDWYGPYETAVSITGNQNMWRIAEGYQTLKEAKEGHKKYESMTKQELENLDYID